MTQIFLAPRSNETSYENFESTILGGRPYKEIEPYLTVDEKEILSAYPILIIWGNKESLKSRWKKMNPGDYVLFYAGGKFCYSARVVLTKQNDELGLKLWPKSEDGKPWNCLFFVDNLREIDIPIKTIQQLAQYKPSWDRVQGFMALKDIGVKTIQEKFGSIEKFIGQDFVEDREEVVEGIKDEYLDKKELLLLGDSYKAEGDGYRIKTSPHKVRIENRKQKEIVAKLEDYQCQVCGWSIEWIDSKGEKKFRIDVDHIIEKADKGTEELSNLWALCPNCHVKKTVGVIKVDLNQKKAFENGKIIKLHHDNHLKW